jgi:protein-L-isoaspartate(D-aspartate) O-methyltransferase
MSVPQIFIDTLIAPSCQNDERIISAFKSVDRALFLPEPMRHRAYANEALPIGFGQTISQPSLVAYMLKELNCAEAGSCLEIGAGSGFLTALLSKLIKYVYALELLPQLAEGARAKIYSLNIANAKVFCGDGTLGYERFAPYDRIIVSAGAKNLPENLVTQLNEGGIMLIPMRNSLLKLEKKDGNLVKKALADVSFVDFVGT